MEKAPDVAGCRAIAAAAAVITVTLQFIERCRAAHISQRRTLQQQPLDLRRLRLREHDLRQLQLLLHILRGEVLALEEPQQHIKLVMGVDGEKFQFPHQLQRAVLYAEKQIIQVMVQVVVDLQAPLRHGGVQRNDAAAAEHIHQRLIAGGQQHLDGPHELRLAAYPRDELFRALLHSPNFSSARSKPLMAASSPLRIFSKVRMVS